MKKLVFTVVFLVLLIVIFTTVINIYMINNTKNRIININNLDSYKDADAILVLGCKAYNDRPSLMLSKNSCESDISSFS